MNTKNIADQELDDALKRQINRLFDEYFRSADVDPLPKLKQGLKDADKSYKAVREALDSDA